jgi:hypothetical protein
MLSRIGQILRQPPFSTHRAETALKPAMALSHTERGESVIILLMISALHSHRGIANVIVFGFLCSTCAGQQSPSPVTIPTPIILGLVFMQGEVNDSAALNVVLDTGSSETVVSPSVVQATGIGSNHTVEAKGIGKGSSQTLHMLDDCELEWGNYPGELRLLHQQGASIAIDYVSAGVGKRVDAFFGSNLFLQYTVTTDYEHERTTFALSGSGPAPAGSSIPVKIIGNVPYVEATIEGEDGKAVTGLFLLDSGTADAKGAMILSKTFLNAHPGLIAETHLVDAPAVTAVGGIIHFKLAKVHHLTLGPFHFSEVVAGVPDASSGVLANANIAGFIGAGILKRFTVAWDYTHSLMFLLPNRALEAPFETDASGIHLLSPGPQYQGVVIDSVLPNSPAALAGLEAGDEILSIDSVRGAPLWKVSEALRKAGTTVVLEVQRKATTLKIKLPLSSPFHQAE